VEVFRAIKSLLKNPDCAKMAQLPI
jgi:hypothetical protein